jgi:hypothetical protein
VFKAPPIEWIADRLRALQPLLEAEPSRSGLLLRRVLGPVRLDPIAPQVGKAYYQAETALQALDLIEAPEAGSTWSHWWTQSLPIRTLAQLPLGFPIIETRQPFLYQYLAEKASKLERLGMSVDAIARALNVTHKTITKALRFAARNGEQSP